MRRQLQTTLAFLFVALLLAPAAWGQSTEDDKLVDNDDAGLEAGAGAIATDATGNRVIVGKEADDLDGVGGDNENSGSAFIYVRDDGANTYSFEQMLTADDAAGAEQFGAAVDMSDDGNRVIVGSRFDDTDAGGMDAGSAFIFSRGDDGEWTQDEKIVGSDSAPADRFGRSVAMDSTGERVAIGAPRNNAVATNDLPFEGAVYVFNRDDGGGTFYEEAAKLTADDANGREQFGWEVSMDGAGDDLLIGAIYEDLDGDAQDGSEADPDSTGQAFEDEGAAYLFESDDDTGSSWTQTDKLTAGTAADREVGDRFGSDVAISSDGERSLVGAFQDDFDGFENAGSAYVFDGSTQTAMLTADDADGAEQFGFSVSTDDTGNRMLVGAHLEDLGMDDEGAAYVFSRSGDGYEQSAKLVASDAAFNDRFGNSVAISDGPADSQYAFSGAIFDDTDGNTNEGSAYTYGPSKLPVELVAFDGTADGEDAAQLSWRTATETGNDRFEILKESGDNWQKIGERNGAGTTTEAQTYSFHVTGLTPGAHTFRLRQVDRDGTATLSDPVSVQVGMAGRAQLNAPFPNPTRSGATVQFAVKEQAPVTVTLHDALGREVRTLFEGTPEAAGQLQPVRIEAGSLSSGLYLVRLEGAGGASQTETLTVVR